MSDLNFVLEQFEQLQATSTEAALYDIFERAMAGLGGTGFALASLPEASRMVVSYSRGLNGWCEHFVENGLAANCVVTQRIAVATQPFLWSDAECDAVRPQQEAVFRAAETFGLTDGLIVPVRTREGFKGNVFVRMAHDLLTPPIRQIVAMLSLAFQSHLMVLQTQPVPAGKVLSGRERDVLSWFAAGKSAQDVADIMGITAATVMFHYRNIADRYGTLTRTHTVVEAIRRGAISVH